MRIHLVAFSVFCIALAPLAGAQSVAQAPAIKPEMRAALAREVPGAKAEDLRPSPISGLYEFSRGADIAYMSGDAKYIIDGDIFDVAKHENLTEVRRRDARVQLLNAFSEGDMIVFAPPAKDAKYTVTVFTDVDCGFCQKFHSQIADYNRLGIRVRYLFFPRTGPDTESWAKADRVWCSKDRNDALTRAKRGEAVEAKPCGPTPVARSYALGRDFAIRGTPAIVLSNGDLLPGYMPPPMLAQQLKAIGR
ncbi:MAG: thioredoxin fold domain-containing protein [Steroidobacteraceae bacterium]